MVEVMGGTIAVGGVLIRDSDTGEEVERLDAWPNPLPHIGDVIHTYRIRGTVMERTFRSYGHGWGVTIWVDTTKQGYTTATFLERETV
jgi:hypothetical protein